MLNNFFALTAHDHMSKEWYKFMAEYRDQKEMKMAMNGRMGLMTGGMLLLFTSITTTLMYGINLFSIAAQAEKGNEEYTQILETSQMGIPLLRVIAACFIIVACFEIYTGIFCILRCNRIDKAVLTKRLLIALLAVEIAMQIFLTVTRMLNFSMLFTALLIPGYMLWAASKMVKLRALYPDRSTALNTKKMKEQRKALQTQAAAKPKKSLHERAMMTAPKTQPKAEETARQEDAAGTVRQENAAEATPQEDVTEATLQEDTAEATPQIESEAETAQQENADKTVQSANEDGTVQ